MPKQIKKKVTKGPVVSEDILKGLHVRALDYFRAGRKNLIIIGSLAVAMIVLYFIIALYNTSLRQEAYALELEAYDYYYGVNLKGTMTEEERWGKALELFSESVKVRPVSTSVFYLGNSYYKLGDFDNAIKEYNVFIREFGGEEEILPLVYQKLSAAYIKTGREEEALTTMGKLAGVGGGVFRDTALALEARYYESVGKPEAGLEKYRELASEFPDSQWFSEAKSRIEMKELEKSQEEKKEEGKVEKVPVELEEK